jgi:prepilin-type N-terminal cleavage/methylation domain-containing protein
VRSERDRTRNGAFGRGGRRRPSAFTLVELLVALALMTILLTMIAQIFFRAGKTVAMARASVEIHQNARVALDTMLRDLASARMCNYANREGYFALSRDASGNPVLAFTTLATQDGATPLVKGVDAQFALVRYSLEASGRPVQTEKNQAPRPVYYLIKKVRFPQLAHTYVDMEEFSSDTRIEAECYPYPPATPPPANYVPAITSDVLALGVLSMNVRFLYAPGPGDGGRVYYQTVYDSGVSTAAGPASVTDNTKNWTSDAYKDTTVLRLLSWYGANLGVMPSGNTANTVNFPGQASMTAGALPPSYRIEAIGALWYTGGNTTVTTGSPNVVGGGGIAWVAGGVQPGDVFFGPDYAPHCISAVVDDTHLTLATAYAGPTATGNHVIYRRPAVTNPTWLTVAPSGANAVLLERLPPSEMSNNHHVRMPALVEVTLEMTDRFGTRTFTFTERFHVPASGW